MCLVFPTILPPPAVLLISLCVTESQKINLVLFFGVFFFFACWSWCLYAETSCVNCLSQRSSRLPVSSVASATSASTFLSFFHERACLFQTGRVVPIYGSRCTVTDTPLCYVTQEFHLPLGNTQTCRFRFPTEIEYKVPQNGF